MLKAVIKGKLIDKAINKSKSTGKEYYNLYLIQDGQRSSQQVGVTETTYQQATTGNDISVMVKIYANNSKDNNPFLSCQMDEEF